MPITEKIAWHLLALIGFMLLVGVVSDTVLRHSVQVAPGIVGLVLLLRRIPFWVNDFSWPGVRRRDCRGAARPVYRQTAPSPFCISGLCRMSSCGDVDQSAAVLGDAIGGRLALMGVLTRRAIRIHFAIPRADRTSLGRVRPSHYGGHLRRRSGDTSHEVWASRASASASGASGRAANPCRPNQPTGKCGRIRKTSSTSGRHRALPRAPASAHLRVSLAGTGGSLAALQEILGHASIVTTQRYGRLGEAHVQAEAARIQGQLGTPHGTPTLRQSG